MSEQRESSTPLSSFGADDRSSPLGGFAPGRATTTERRTTTTTTTKRTIKSSDDFLPNANDMQQESFSSSNTTSGAGERPSSRHDSVSSHSQQQRASNYSATTTTVNDRVASDSWEDTDTCKLLKVRFDVSEYEPEEIIVKTSNNRLQIQAKHEEKYENKTVYREYNREFILPEGTDIESIRSLLSKDGVLTVECPIPKTKFIAPSRQIPIEKS